MFCCNHVGLHMAALPTLVAYPNSHAFRGGRPGELVDSAGCPVGEPNPDERERALGYDTGATAAVAARHRHAITGRCMDANALESLFAASEALHRHTTPFHAVSALTCTRLPPSPRLELGGGWAAVV